MPRFYAKVLNATLTDFIAEQTSSPVHEQVSVLEELHLTRHTAREAIAMYGITLGEKPENMDAKTWSELHTSAGADMRRVLQEVVGIAERAANIESRMKDKVSTGNLANMVGQINRIAHSVLKDHQELAEQFETALRDEIRLQETIGTTSTPDQDVREMDDATP